MNHKIFLNTIALFFIYILSNTNAQTTGKLTGRVTAAETGEPLPYANIILVDTKIGAATDIDGYFLILNVPPGLYSLEAKMMGYGSVRQEGVQISVNRTTDVNFALNISAVSTETVVITADKMTIKKDQTSSIRNVSSQDIEALPVDNISQIVALQPGVVGGNHFRGGRSNEVAYLVDGVAVTESFNHESKMVEVNPDAVADLEVISGTFNAEYGNAMSGVVNVVTKDGGDKIEVSASASAGNYFTSHGNIFQGVKYDDVPIQDYRISISGPVVKDYVGLFVDGRYFSNNGYLYGVNRFNVNDYSNFNNYPTSYISESNGDDSYVPMDKSESNYLMGKLSFTPSSEIKTSLIYTLNSGTSRGYSHAFSYNPYGLGSNHNTTNMFGLHFNHIFDKTAFYVFKLTYVDYQTGYYLYEDPLDPRYISDQYSISSGGFFSSGGQDKNHNIRTEKTIKLNFDITWQLDKNHSLKSGVDFSQINLEQKYYNIRNVYEGTDLESEFYVDTLTNKIIYPYYKPELRSDSTIYSDVYNKKPIQFAAYLQDKMEFESMVINFGLRFDYFDPKTKYPSNERNPANQDYFVDQSRMSQYLDAPSQSQISPRLGLSYQLGSTALLRFSYGHFFQTPPLNYYYQNNTFIVSDLGMVGNPLLKAQKTVQYEIGFWKELTDNMNFEVAVFYRDIYNLLSSRMVSTYSQIRYGLFDNKDYGNARGFELTYQAAFGQFFLNANYTLQYSNGVADSPFLAFNRQGQNMDPIKALIPLEWDQRNTFNVAVEYRSESFGATLLAIYNTGRPYTWAPLTESPLAAISLLPNNQVRPTQFNVDFKAFYDIAKIGNANLRLKLLVYNLFDQLNELSVDANTGRAYTGIVRPIDLQTYRSDFSTYYDQLEDPSMYSEPRSIRLGLEINY